MIAPLPASSSLSRSAQAALLVATFTVWLAYGTALPVLPVLLEQRLGPGSEAAGHTGLLIGTYAIALFLLAPFWGRQSDRRQRRPIILLGMAGFTFSLLLLAFIDSLVALYLGRFLTGAFAAAVLPVSLAMIGDWAPNDDWRARRFSWLTMAGLGGFLFGPIIGGVTAQAWDQGTSPSGLLFLSMAAFAAATTLGTWLFLPLGEPGPGRLDQVGQAPARLMPVLLLLVAIVSVALGTFEVGLDLMAELDLDLGPAEIGAMFAECMLVMIAVQGAVFNRWFPASATRWLVMPALTVLAGTLALMPWVHSRGLLLLIVGLFAASAGVLLPILSFWISLAAGNAQGGELGRQTAVSSFGQAIGSAIGGLLFGLIPIFPNVAFLVAAAGTVVGGGLALRLPKLLAVLVPPEKACEPISR